MRAPTTYLQRWLPKLSLAEQAYPIVLDLGCGSGRNSLHVAARIPTARVFAYDADPDEGPPYTRTWFAGEALKHRKETIHLVLLQYLLMFISPTEQEHVLREVTRVVAPGGYLLVELYKTKRGRDVSIDDVIVALGDDWRCINLCRQRAVFEKRRGT